MTTLLRTLAILLGALALTSLSVANPGTVLVVGATGGTGQHIVRQLQETGYPLVAMVRNVDKARSLFGDAVPLVTADVTDPATLPAALEGVDLVISALGASLDGEGKASPESVDYHGTVALIDAARAAGVSKFVLITSGGTTWWLHPLNWFGQDVLKWKRKAEIHLRESGLTHVIVRPAGGLKDEPGNTQTIVFTQNDGIPSTITRADVATVSIAALKHPEANNKTFEIKDSGKGTRVSDVDWTAVFSAMTEQSDNF